MRNHFSAEVTRQAIANEKIVLLSGDIGNRLFDDLKKARPNQFINCGIAEANMMSMAAGMAMCGLRPIVYTITPFVTTRCLEQIRVDVCYHDVPVIIVGVGSGLSYASLGATHHSCEDIAFLRALPNMTIFAPGDPIEVRGAVRAALNCEGPVYIRMGKKNEPVVHNETPIMKPGGSFLVREGEDVCLLGVGVMLPECLDAATELEKAGISTAVISLYSVKPLDTKVLEAVFLRFSVVVVVEEHSVVGGAGAAVRDWAHLAGADSSKLLCFGTRDEFMHENAHTAYARSFHGLDVPHIVWNVRQRFKQYAMTVR